MRKIVLPIAFQQFMLALVSASDAVMLGMVDQNSLSAVSLATQITFVYNLFLTAITIGESILAAQYWGKGDQKAVEKTLAVSLRIVLLLSLCFFCAAMFLPTQIMQLFTNNRVLVMAGSEYLRVVSFSYLFCGISQCCLCIMKNSGHATLVMIVSTVMVLMNIGLNGMLIFGLADIPALGITGAALATTITRIAELLLILIWMSWSRNCILIRVKYLWKPDQTLHGDYWRYTLPVLGNELVWGCGFTMYSVIMGHLGTDAVAANSMANIVKNLVACFCIGLGSGGGILVGNELGAGRFDEAKALGRKLTIWSIVSGVLTGAVILVFQPAIVAVTALSQNADELLRWMLLVCAVNMIGKSINSTTIGGIFCAGGDSKFGLVCDSITMWCITVPLGLLTAFVWRWPIVLVYLILNSDELIKLPAVFIHYKKYGWVRRLTKEEVSQEDGTAEA